MAFCYSLAIGLEVQELKTRAKVQEYSMLKTSFGKFPGDQGVFFSLEFLCTALYRQTFPLRRRRILDIFGFTENIKFCLYFITFPKSFEFDL